MHGMESQLVKETGYQRPCCSLCCKRPDGMGWDVFICQQDPNDRNAIKRCAPSSPQKKKKKNRAKESDAVS